MHDASISALRETVRGPVFAPGDEGYDEARAVQNGMHDRRPAVVIRAADVADVRAGVALAREQGVDLAVRGGGHSVPGFGTCDDGVVLDLSGMRWVHVDPEARTARAGGGTTWGDFNHAANAFGLATPGGIISTTGIAGLTLGGGIGYLARGCGLSCDNLLSADVVTADGRFLKASDQQNEDLFWALRGGGGNFGVVTALEYQLHEIPELYGGPIFFELEDAPTVMAGFADYISQAPEQSGGFFGWQIAPPLPFIPEDRHGDTLCLLVMAWAGPSSEGERALKPMRNLAPIVAEHVGPMPYPALNAAFDGLYPKGLQHYWKTQFIRELTPEAIAAHIEHGARVPEVTSTMHIYPINGAVHRVASDETAFPFRDVTYSVNIAGMWPDPADNEANIAWVRDYYEAIKPYGTDAGYVNFMSGDDADRVPVSYAANYQRLRDVKKQYDPDNLFHLNQNIR